ncbi:MAG: amidohydrolase family protein, partial [Calditrichota bacterium]
APEAAPDFPLIQRLLDAGVVPALGHTIATYQQTQEYFDQGIAHITHLYNAMSGLHHREPGPLLAILESKTVTAQIICDGRHVNPDMVRWTYQQLGGDRCVCITDGMEAMGLPEGRYSYNGVEYESRNGSAFYLNGTLIGTALPLAQMALNFHRFTSCDLETAINAGTLNPARVLGIEDKKGTLEPGKDADIVIFDEDNTIWATLVEGRLAYQS